MVVCALGGVSRAGFVHGVLAGAQIIEGISPSGIKVSIADCLLKVVRPGDAETDSFLLLVGQGFVAGKAFDDGQLRLVGGRPVANAHGIADVISRDTLRRFKVRIVGYDERYGRIFSCKSIRGLDFLEIVDGVLVQRHPVQVLP